MSTEQEAPIQRLIDLLQTHAGATEDSVRRLAEALVPDPSYSHEQAEQELPDYVTDELLGRPVAELYPVLHRHLLHCQACAGMHISMLTTFDEAPEFVAIPEPNLHFLPPVDARRELLKWVREIIHRGWPRLSEPFDQIAELFFAQIDQGRDVRLSRGGVPVTAFAFGAGDAPVSLQVLTAAHIAGQSLTARYGSLERAAGSLESERQRIAAIVTEAAGESGFAKQDRQQFVEAYLALLFGQGGPDV